MLVSSSVDGDSSVRWATEHIYAHPRLGGSVTRPHTAFRWCGRKTLRSRRVFVGVGGWCAHTNHGGVRQFVVCVGDLVS